MNPWRVNFTLSNDNRLVYSINSNDVQEHQFHDFPVFQAYCKAWSTDVNAINQFATNIDAQALGNLFKSSQPNQTIEIESENCHFIPFEGLTVDNQFLSERNPVSRKAIGFIWAGRNFKLKSVPAPILIIKVFALENHQYYENQIISTLRHFPNVYFESHTATSLDELIGHLINTQRAIIHIIGHIVDDSFTDGENVIRLGEFKTRLMENDNVFSNLIFLTCCGKLDFEKMDEEKLFSPFFNQTHVNAVVGMTRTIHAKFNQGYLDEFYHSILTGKTFSEAVMLTVRKNKNLPDLIEEHPLPIAYFGPSNCRFIVPNRKLMLSAIGLGLMLLVLVFVFLSRQPSFKKLYIRDLSLSGRILNLPKPPTSMRHVLVAAVSLSTGKVVWPEERYFEIEDNSFSIQLFNNYEERSQATTCFLLIVDISSSDELFLNSATIGEFRDWVNANDIYSYERKLN
ncbi:MAG: hypothetical protein LBT59_04915 [Clostridiales bacterium]|jgi:hypothetical protein|nr:hypothetical protein [Clostridiales bacterium]